jgi:hypothetical protein
MAIDDTGWRAPSIVADGGAPKGLIQMPSATQAKPCYLCKSFENDRAKLIQHLLSKGLVPDEAGVFTTPIVQDFDGRKSLEINPDDYGFCRRDCIVVAMNATCANWELTRFREDMIAKLRK